MIAEEISSKFYAHIFTFDTFTYVESISSSTTDGYDITPVRNNEFMRIWRDGDKIHAQVHSPDATATSLVYTSVNAACAIQSNHFRFLRATSKLSAIGSTSVFILYHCGVDRVVASRLEVPSAEGDLTGGIDIDLTTSSSPSAAVAIAVVIAVVAVAF